MTPQQRLLDMKLKNQFGESLTPYEQYLLIEEIERLQKELQRREKSEIEFLQTAQVAADKLVERAKYYRKALEEIEDKASSDGLAVPLVKACKNIARKALKGQESK